MHIFAFSHVKQQIYLSSCCYLQEHDESSSLLSSMLFPLKMCFIARIHEKSIKFDSVEIPFTSNKI